MKQIFPALIVLLLFGACKKEKATLCITGTIQWGGEPAVDGLGWYFETPEFSKPVKLKNLPSNYQVNDLAVAACLMKTEEKYQCFCAAPMDVYAIINIRNR
ncbi:MAG: hypothetical protein KA160_02185 [Lacibacter sp.]|nr:hypothetical protein [Lacibacter sp.]